MRSKKCITMVVALLCMVLIFSMYACDGRGGTQVEPPEPVYKVNSVVIRHNSTPVEGTLSVNMTAGTVALAAGVTKDAEADGTVTWSSGDTAVATVADDGTVTLLKSGETVITAAAGNKKHEIVLVVGAVPTQPNAYTITVNGGTSNTSSAVEGSRITLTPDIPEHNEFVRWEYKINGEPADNLSVSGHLFLMPGANISVTAVFGHARYALNLVGAKVVKLNGEEYTETGVPGANTKPNVGGGALEEYALTTYQIPVTSTVLIETVDEPADKLFVGWDEGTINNRLADMSTEHEFTMPGETLTVWAQFGARNHELLTDTGAANGPSGGNGNYSEGFRRIWQGQPALNDGSWTPDPSASVDPDLDGGSGYRLTYSAAQGAASGNPENITGSKFNTMGHGTLVMKWIFKNHSETRAIVLEAYATQLGNNVTTGHVRVEPGEVKVVYTEGRLGLQNPWMGCVVREAIGGSSGEPRVLVDMVCVVAPKYPDGDKVLAVSGNAQWVNFHSNNQSRPYSDFPQLYGGSAFTRSGTWANADAHWVNNAVGLTMLAAWGANISLGATASVRISNMPAYNSDQPTTTVYLRVVNNIAQVATYKWGISTLANDTGTYVVTFPGAPGEETPDRGGGYTLGSFESKVIKLVIPRTQNDGGLFYLTVLKTYRDTTGSSDGVSGQHLCMQMAYNNVFGYEEV